MSGGSFNYAYSRAADEVGYVASTLANMAAYLRDTSRYKQEKYDMVLKKYIPCTIEELILIQQRAEILEREAKKLQSCADRITKLSATMHDVEWWKSGDDGCENLIAPLSDDLRELLTT